MSKREEHLPEDRPLHGPWMEEEEEESIFEDSIETLEDTSIEIVGELRGVHLPFEVTTPERTHKFPDAWTSTPKMAGVEEKLSAAEIKLAETRLELTNMRELMEGYRQELKSLQHAQVEASRIYKDDRAEAAKAKHKIPLPGKYEGDVDFDDYLQQFEVLADEHEWTTEKKGVMLLARLKGRALEVAAKGGDVTFRALATRLRNHFSPEHEEMYAQRLQALQKTTKQTWEDLAYEVRNLTVKGYRDVGETTRERLGAQAFVNAIPEDHVRNKVRDAHPRTVAEALERVRQVEADLSIEKQRARQVEDGETSKDKPRAGARIVTEEESQDKMRALEEKLKALQTQLEGKTSEKPQGRGRGGT